MTPPASSAASKWANFATPIEELGYNLLHDHADVEPESGNPSGSGSECSLMCPAHCSQGRLQRWASTIECHFDRFFQISAKGSCIAAELRGGVAGWMTMSYIIIVNPAILHIAADRNGIDLGSLMTSTALAAAVASLLAGLISNLPLGMMPGMGLNAYFTYGICKALGLSFQEALSCSFVAGVGILLLCALGACDWIVSKMLSDHLKKAITAAIGLFQAMIGFQVMGLVVYSPTTLVTIGDLSPTKNNAELYLAIGGLLLIVGLLVGRKMQGSLLIGIMSVAVLSWVTGLRNAPATIFAAPSFGGTLQVDFSGWHPSNPKLPDLVTGAAVILFVCLFDVAGVQHGLRMAAGLPPDPKAGSRVIACAGLGTAAGAILGTSPVIVANESGASIMEGARTGLAALVQSLLFVASAFISPVLCSIPQVATAMPLIIVGAFMMAPCGSIDWQDFRVSLPCFLTMTVVPFTYSIHSGIVFGLLADWYLALAERLCLPARAARDNSPPPSPRLTAAAPPLDSLFNKNIGDDMDREQLRQLLVDFLDLQAQKTGGMSGSVRFRQQDASGDTTAESVSMSSGSSSTTEPPPALREVGAAPDIV